MTRAAVLDRVHGTLHIEDLELEPPRVGEVRVRIAACGVCHSDLSIYDGTLPLPLPAVLGHEASGIVTAAGADVADVSVGDHVVLSIVPQCGVCFYCERGQAQLCEQSATTLVSGGLLDGTPRFSLRGVPVHQMLGLGAFAEETVVPAMSVVKIDPTMPLVPAALIGCGVLTGIGAALNTAEIRDGDSIVVFGCGGVGLNVIQGARLAGAARIVAVDRTEAKSEPAKQFGATDFLVTSPDTEAEIHSLTGGRGADVVFEVVGRSDTIDQAVRMTRAGGQTILVGAPALDVALTIPVFLGLLAPEKTIRGCWYGSSNVAVDVARLTSLYMSGDILLDELITSEFRLDEVNNAFASFDATGTSRSVVVNRNGPDGVMGR